MRKRIEWEKVEKNILASYAVKSSESRGRKHPEKKHLFRSDFQRDRDRIIHSTAFRKLEYKTQVFIYHEGDYYRNRLTHTMEVQQIARTIARILRLNEDLVEAISLAHDIGHTPFGHRGEATLNELVEGGFEHNHQGLKIVDVLEERYQSFPGLNLTFEVREGIIRHKTSYDTPLDSHFEEFTRDISPSLETQVVNFADEIAYTTHDLDDGIKSEIIPTNELNDITLWQEISQPVKKGNLNYTPTSFSHKALRSVASPTRRQCNTVLIPLRTSTLPPQGGRLRRGGKEIPVHLNYELQRIAMVRKLINLLVTDIVNNSLKNINKTKVSSVDEIRKSELILAYTEKTESKHMELKKFLEEKMYFHYRVIRMTQKAHRIISDLFRTYMKEPRQLPPHIQKRIGSEKRDRVICDYIAGMTDRFAMQEHQKLFDPNTLV